MSTQGRGIRSRIGRLRPAPIEPALRRQLTVVMFGTLLITVDLTVVNVALDSIGHDLDASLSSTQWVVTSYALAIAAALPISGWLGRRFGTRSVYIGSLIGFTVASGLCTIAGSINALIAYRILQGAAGGVLLPVGQTLLAHAAGPKRLGRVMGAITSVAVLSPILGPTIGGLIVNQLSWRWIFAVNLPIGIVAIVLAFRRLPRTERQAAGPIDWVGFGLLTLGLPLLIYGLAEYGEAASPTSLRATPAFVVGVLLVVAFVWHALRTEHPLLDLRLYRLPTFAAAAVGSALVGAAVFGPYLLMPLFYQDVQGASAFRAGLLFAPQGLGAAVAVVLIARHTDTLGGGFLACIGAFIMAVDTIPFLTFDAGTPAWEFVVVLAVRGFGIGLVMMPLMVAALAAIPRESISDASPQLSVVQRVGGSIGTAILAVVLANRLRSAGPRIEDRAAAFHHTFVWVIVLNVLTIVPALVLARIERRARRGAASEAELAQAGAA